MLYNLFENRDFVSVFAVALLAEGVDRNLKSPSSITAELQVALLAEGVDRNIFGRNLRVDLVASPSSRRAWIDIMECERIQIRTFCRPPRGGRG